MLFIYLSPVIDVFLADEALLDAGRAVVADGDVAARQEEDVPLLVGANDALVQTLFVVDAVVVRRPRHVRHQVLSLAGITRVEDLFRAQYNTLEHKSKLMGLIRQQENKCYND